MTTINAERAEIAEPKGGVENRKLTIVYPSIDSRSAIRHSRLTAIGLALIAVLAATGPSPLAQDGSKTVWDGVYTEAQAKLGETVSKATCQACHGERLSGDMGPGLAGDEFVGAWDGKPAGELFDRIRTTMPQGNENTLTAKNTADLVAYIFQLNKFPPGQSELSPDAASLGHIRIQARQ